MFSKICFSIIRAAFILTFASLTKFYEPIFLVEKSSYIYLGLNQIVQNKNICSRTADLSFIKSSTKQSTSFEERKLKPIDFLSFLLVKLTSIFSLIIRSCQIRGVGTWHRDFRVLCANNMGELAIIPSFGSTCHCNFRACVGDLHYQINWQIYYFYLSLY